MGSILITGGAGFIGSHFLKFVESESYDQVIIFDKLTYASDFDFIQPYLNNKVIFVQGDICDKAALENLFDKYPIIHVVNFAAESHVDKSIEGMHSFIETNIKGVQILMDVILENRCEATRFLHISTDEVYGPSNDIEAYPFTETSCLNPANPYAATKASAELLINAYINTYGIPALITRSSNNYGTNQNKEKLIPSVIDAIIKHQPIQLYGDGKYYRNWLFVDDNCRSIYHVLKYGELFEIYNISGNHFISNLDLTKLIIEIFETSFNHHYKGHIEFIEDRKGHDLCYRIDDEKIKRFIHFETKDFIEGMTDLIKYYFESYL